MFFLRETNKILDGVNVLCEFLIERECAEGELRLAIWKSLLCAALYLAVIIRISNAYPLYPSFRVVVFSVCNCFLRIKFHQGIRVERIKTISGR